MSYPDVDHKDLFMRWKHIQVLRDGEPGRFDCKLEFVNLKAIIDDLSLTLDKPFKMRPKSPLSTNFIPLSIPHRILTILLRGDALIGYPVSAFSSDEERVEDLLSGKRKIHQDPP